MIAGTKETVVRLSLACMLLNFTVLAGSCQRRAEENAPKLSTLKSLDLSADVASLLNKALVAHNYVDAEKILLAQIDEDPHSSRAARLLAYIGSIYFLNHDNLNAAIALKKSDAIHKLDPALQFSLAMAYIGIGHEDWARKLLESLSIEDPKEALYPYWLGRLDYDSHSYETAITHLKQAIAIDPGMSRAYNNLGLCYFYRNENILAVESYKKAIELSAHSEHPSAWPYLNLGVTLQFLGQDQEAQTSLRQAIQIDPRLATAHYYLGTVLESLEQSGDAMQEMVEAARLDASYAEPHLALARLYKRTGRKDAADAELRTYKQLHALPAKTPLTNPARE